MYTLLPMTVTYENIWKLTKVENPIKVVIWENLQRVVRCKKPRRGKITFSSVRFSGKLRDINRIKWLISYAYGEPHINENSH